MLTPLGDPPLFLGFLRGVPFLWTLRLWAPWALVNGILLVAFHLLDQAILDREERERPGPQLEEVQRVREPLRIEGSLNLLLLLGVVAILYLSGTFGSRLTPDPNAQTAVQVLGMAFLAAVSLLGTETRIREANRFTWGPIVEVAVVFAGVFVTMVPALKYLEARAAAFGLSEPWQFFWATGLLSSFLDNAPTYLTFSAAAVGVVNQVSGASLVAEHLGALAAHPFGAELLAAISCGAVFMGANTYIGNGPNFMVKAIAEESGIPMPSFLGYMLWSGAILLPLFLVVTLVFFG
jgi:Na+/H+ antiporter NhaD/arsenite permease-like protein